MTNYGTLAINTDTNLDATIANYGTFAIAPGTNAILTPFRSVSQLAGSLTTAPDVPLTVTSSTFHARRRTVNGTVNLAGSAGLLFTGGSGGNFVVQDTDHPQRRRREPGRRAGQQRHHRARRLGRRALGAELRRSRDQPRHDHLDSAGAVAGATLNITSPTFTHYGTLNSNVGSGGARTVNANTFNNYGTINVNAQTTFNADVFNAGAIHLNEAATFRSLTGPGSLSGSGQKTFTGDSTLEAINTKTGDTVVEAAAHLTVGSINDGDVTVNGLMTIAPSGGQSGASRVDSLTIGGAGKVDVTDNKLVITGPTASVAAVEAAIATASNGGTWDGPSGITTGMPDAAGGLTSVGVATAGQAGYGGGTFAGVSVAGDDVWSCTPTPATRIWTASSPATITPPSTSTSSSPARPAGSTAISTTTARSPATTTPPSTSTSSRRARRSRPARPPRPRA
jgi:hypothetical protein